MAIAIVVGRDESEASRYDWFTTEWRNALLKLDTSLDIRIWPEVGKADDIELVLIWQHPVGELQRFHHAKAIVSLAAGVDHAMIDPNLNPAIPLVRVVDPYMANDIVQYVVAAVLHYVKRMDHWELKQREKQWSKEPPFTFADKTIGVMGLGFLGSKAATALQQLGLNVIGFSNSPKKISGIQDFSGQAALHDFLSQTDILVCMLPLTPQTKTILNAETFSSLRDGAYVINVGRGEQLDEEALLDALARGKLSGACLDVFRKEPLPSDHPFWVHPHIRVTPHIASVTNPVTAAPQVLENYKRLLNGEPLLNKVNLTKGY